VDSAHLDFDELGETAAADTTTPYVFGILNIIFSLMGGCWAAYALAMAIFMPALSEMMDREREKAQAASAAKIESLEKNLASATTEADRTELRTEIADLQAMPEASLTGPFRAMNNKKVVLYGFVDGATSLYFYHS